MQDNQGNEVQKDVPTGAKVMMRLIWCGAEDPSTNDWPVLPLWVLCPEQIAYNRGDESWTPARPVDKNTEGSFQYPQRAGFFYLEQKEPADMFWVNVRWKAPGLTRGNPAALDGRKDDMQEGEYYAMAERPRTSTGAGGERRGQAEAPAEGDVEPEFSTPGAEAAGGAAAAKPKRSRT
eukprot:1927863-Prymnesium_polylepis.2